MASKETNQCIKCKKNTTIVCAYCRAPICAKHGNVIHHHVYCIDCFFRERKIGLIKAWSLLLGMILAAIFVFYFLM